MSRSFRGFPVLLALLLAGACADNSADQTSTTTTAPKRVATIEVTPAEEAPVETTPAPVELEADLLAQGATTTDAAKKFTAWKVVHSFLGSPVIAGQVVSATEAIAFTKDNHVGITQDGGVSWGFRRHVNGKVLAATGNSGGPYVVCGKAGYLAISRDGKTWNDLPRFTNDDLIGVAISDNGVVAIGKRGVYVRFDKTATHGTAGLLPEGFKAKALTAMGGKFLAFAGKKGYASTTGGAWIRLDALPDIPSGKFAATSRGICKLGKVGKSKGVVCTVAGVAHGLSAKETLVDSKKTVAFSKDGGSTWVVSTLPFGGFAGAVGNPGGPFFAYGKGGGLAMTRDGTSWTQVTTNVNKALLGGLVDGTTVLIVGDKGTVLRSTDGGENFTALPAPTGKKLTQVVKVAGRYVISLGKAGLESTDGGQTWTEITDPAVMDQVPARAKAGKCEGRVPNPGETCKFSRTITSTRGLPKVRGFHFKGDVGLAMGDAGLVGFTSDGGATWRHRNGFALRGLQGFDVRGDRIVALGGKTVIVSTDAGKAFREAPLPKKTGKINDTVITADGSVYACGKGGTVLKSDGNLSSWSRLDTGPKNKTNFLYLHEVGKVLFAAGKGGELYRSENQGATWWPVATGVKFALQKMAGEGNTVVAVTHNDRPKKGGNLLLRSDDGGRHFYVQREISHNGSVGEFSLASGTLRYRDRVSSDFGATWTLGQENYWPGAIDIGDGSGFRVVNFERWRGKSRFFVVGQGEKDWTLVDSFYNRGAWFRCDPASGCWMVSGGQVYRPL